MGGRIRFFPPSPLYLGVEAAVAGGIPVIRTLQTAYAADRISRIGGVLNGTTNFILDAMNQRGLSYNDALKEAQDLGFAEGEEEKNGEER